MANKLNGAYEPQKTEDKIYQSWEQSGFFNPDKLKLKKGAKPFTIIMPPPNANGALHIGHALFVTLQDIMVRFHRMRGNKTLWLPGADHAGFETQVVFDKKLEKEGKKRADFSRGELYKQIWDFTQENKKVMEKQLKKLGASCDWSREKFTLDADIVEKVQDTFIKLYNDGLIYRGARIVNWCTKHQTTLSELEVKHEERIDPLYYIKYGPLELATVRPETKFGDTAVAVHPDDKRYKHLVGQEIEIETVLGKAKIKVIADKAVDPKFGTGVIKVTPAHDPTDFEIGLRHNLEVRQVIDKNGRLNERTGIFAGLKVGEARLSVVEAMKEKGILVKIDPSYRHNVSVCYKCGNIVEPMVMPQWFIRMTAKPHAQNQKSKIKNQNFGMSLRDAAVRTVKSGQIKFIPKRFEKIFFHWMKNLRDWNISRQIIWGIRIPAWFRDNEIIVSKIKPIGEDWVQDPDVLDTWFSSGQWPFLTLLTSGESKSKIKNQKSKLPYTSKDFKTFYPTDVMETGWDILFFWVARMIMLGIYATAKIPFKTVYLHGLVRDQDRKKMSKSRGNVIDPLGVAEMYGTDAVRMALVIGSTAGNDPIISENKIRGYRNFANKIWNASRFVLMHTGATSDKRQATRGIKFTKEDKKRLKELDALVKSVTRDLESLKFHHAGEKLYHYFWHTFADKIIEEAKPRLSGNNSQDRDAARALLYTILKTNLILLHPFMPFVTETIWQKMPQTKKNLLIIEKWPT
ncbi:MAG: valine--tRNA ligase [Candidatus Sungbacteria bacterium]|nr:valine--tRNA ligase [Candidatus Sungbacteria bacterium]